MAPLKGGPRPAPRKPFSQSGAQTAPHLPVRRGEVIKPGYARRPLAQAQTSQEVGEHGLERGVRRRGSIGIREKRQPFQRWSIGTTSTSSMPAAPISASSFSGIARSCRTRPCVISGAAGATSSSRSLRPPRTTRWIPAFSADRPSPARPTSACAGALDANESKRCVRVYALVDRRPQDDRPNSSLTRTHPSADTLPARRARSFRRHDRPGRQKGQAPRPGRILVGATRRSGDARRSCARSRRLRGALR